MYATRTRRCGWVVLGWSALVVGVAPAGSGAAAAVGASSATDVAAATPSGGVGNDAVQQEVMLHCWGPLWYLRGRAAYDPVTTAKGAADGSAYIVLQQSKKASAEKTWWVFVSGNMMYVYSTAPAVSAPQTTTRPGDVLESQPGLVSKLGAQPVKINKLLRRVYEYSRATGGEPIRHVPFLTGDGWPPHAEATAGEGAWAPKAKAFLEDMDMEPKFFGKDGTPLDAATVKGYVYWQNPPGGTLLRPGMSNAVTLIVGDPKAGPTEPDKSAPCSVTGGGSFFTAAPVNLTGPGALTLCGVNTNGLDTITARCGTEPRPPIPTPEVVWKILPAGNARTVQVKVPKDDDCLLRGDLRVSVWVCADASTPPPCAFNLAGPTVCQIGDFGPPEAVFLEFPLPAGNTGYLVAEDPYGGSIDVRLVVALK